jgi:hypothetical protein
VSSLFAILAFPLGAGPSAVIVDTDGSPSSTASAILAGVFDQEIDPISLDFIDEDDGSWSETPDSRSIVLCQLELELARSYGTPGDGTTLRSRLESGDPITTSYVEAEVLRAMSVLEELGTIGSVEVSGRDENGDQLLDESGRAAFELSWVDLATGSPVELVYRPLGG